MPKRTILDDLVELPWWVSLVFAGCFYILFNYILPTMSFDNHLIAALARSAGTMGMLIVYLLVFVSIVSGIRQFVRHRRSRSVHRRQTDIHSVRALSWDDFERLIAHAFREEGYRVTENNAKGADRGIDLVLKRDGKTTLVQCKHWRANKIGVNIIRELLGVLVAENADYGIVVGTGKFTQPALDFANTNGIGIIDDEKLIQMLNKQLPEFSTDNIELPKKTTTVECPRCGNPMVKRIAKSGATSGSAFLGCSNFPRCRGTREL